MRDITNSLSVSLPYKKYNNINCYKKQLAIVTAAVKIIIKFQQTRERIVMKKSEIESLWRALCATTCKPVTHAPYDSVCVHNRVVYATNTYVLHRVEGLFQPGMNFRALHGNKLAYLGCVDVLDDLLKYRPDNREFANMIPDYNPEKLMLALRPHRALGSTVKFYSGVRREYAPLIIVSKTFTPKEPIVITTSIQGEKNGWK